MDALCTGGALCGSEIRYGHQNINEMARVDLKMARVGLRITRVDLKMARIGLEMVPVDLKMARVDFKTRSVSLKMALHPFDLNIALCSTG